MKIFLFILFLMLVGTTFSQEKCYTINVPNSARLAAKSIPDSIDTNRYYYQSEIRDVAEPFDGWSSFYQNLHALEYPTRAKRLNLQSKITFVFKIDERGNVTEVMELSTRNHDKWKPCADCETLIIEYIKNTKWTPGNIRGELVKTIQFLDVEFEIYVPTSP